MIRAVRKATARPDLGPAVLTVQAYGSAPQPKLVALATLFGRLYAPH